MRAGSRWISALALIGAVGMVGCGSETRSANAEAGPPAAAVEPREPDAASDLAQGAAPVAPAEVPEPVVEKREPAPPPPVRRNTVPSSEPPTHAPRTEEPVLTTSDPEGSRVDPAPVPEDEPLAVAAGTRMDLRTESTLDTERSRVGDVFWARIVDDVLGENGLVLLPAGARVRGRVLQSDASASSDAPATLAIGFEAVVVDGVELPIDADVLYADVEAGTRDSGGETAAKVAGGAAAGAILGRILGGRSKDAVKGAVVGAAAGAAVAAGTRDGHARLPEGALVEIELKRPVRLIS